MELLDRYNLKEINWFIDKLDKQYKEDELIYNLQRVNEGVVIHGTGTKKGNTQYSKWRMAQLKMIEDLKEDNNVFNKLKRSKKTNTVFDKLKRLGSVRK